MSATAGFDVVMEIAPSAIRAAILAELGLAPPFELTDTRTIAPFGSFTAYTIVTAVEVALDGERDVLIDLPFSGSSIENENPAGLSFYGLDGNVSVRLPLRLVEASDQGAFARTIGFDPDEAEVAVAFTPAATQRIEFVLERAGLGWAGPDALRFAAEQALRDRLAALGQLPVPSLPVKKGTDGGLFPSFRFERLELRNVGVSAVGLFGSFLVADHDRGDPATQDVRPFPPGDDVRFTLSAGAFHRQAVCTGVGAMLGRPATAVPGCGGGPVSYGPGTLAAVGGRFEPGGIVVTGRAADSGFCYEVGVDFSVRWPVSVADGRIVVGDPGQSVGEPDVDIDFPCEVGAFVLGGLFGLGAAELVAVALAEPARAAVEGAVAAFAQQRPWGDGWLPPYATVTGVTFTTEAMTIGGRARSMIPAQRPPSLVLRGGVALLPPTPTTGPNPWLIDLGYQRIKRSCVDGDYPATLRLNRLEAAYSLDAWLIPRPLSLDIALEFQDAFTPGAPPALLASVSLPPAGDGVASVPNARCTDPLPLPDGAVTYRPVTINYRTDRNAIRLANDPADGSYAYSLRLRITDGAGVLWELGTSDRFVGQDVVVGGSFTADLIGCESELVIEQADSYAHVTERPPWKLGGDTPGPDEILAYVHALRRSGNAQLGEFATLVRLAYQTDLLAASLPASALDTSGKIMGRDGGASLVRRILSDG